MEKPVISVVVPTNRPWLWARFARQYSMLTTELVDLELVLIPDAFEESAGWFLDLMKVAPLHAGQVVHPVPVGTPVAAKFKLGASWAHGDFIAFRSDDDIYHPRHFDWLYHAWKMERGPAQPPYIGWGHGWFYAPHIKPTHLSPHNAGISIMAASIIKRSVAIETSWARGGEVHAKGSDTHFMSNLMDRYGERRPLDATTVYGLWVNHQHNMHARSRLEYTVDIADLSNRVAEGDRAGWDALVKDAADTIANHSCATCR